MVTGSKTDGVAGIGVARPIMTETLANGSHPLVWSLDYTGDGVYDGSMFTFGTSYDTLMVGDWNGDGISKIGVARPDDITVSSTFTELSETATPIDPRKTATAGHRLDLPR